MATILIVDDNDTIREGIRHTVESAGYVALTSASGGDALKQFREHTVDFVISDLKMSGLDGMGLLRQIQTESPDTPIMIMTGFGTVEAAVEAMKLGAFDFLTKPFAPEVIALKVQRALELSNTRRAQRKLEAHNQYLSEQLKQDGNHSAIVGESPAITTIESTIRKVAKTDSSVIIYGESGTGKELVAREIHQQSKRANEAFIQVNCAAMADTLMESELFGHEKGAFSGAVRQRLGRFELADGGTLFLDEIGDVSPAMQVKLLRVLQEQRFERVGGEKTITVNVRIISATNKNLQEQVRGGQFRQDLFYRLNVVPITVPPLRGRSEDIPLLVAHFIDKLAPRVNPSVNSISDQAIGRMMTYSWPGNIRELENTVEQALVFCETDTIREETLPGHLRNESSETLIVSPEKPLPETLDDLERQLITNAYAKAAGVKTETARLLGIKTSALYYKLEKYGIS